MVYSRKHLPGATARWLTEALVEFRVHSEALATGVTMSDSMPIFGLYELGSNKL